MPKQTTILYKLNTQTDFKGLCLHVADPATSLAQNCVQGKIFSSENSLFIQVMEK